MHADNDEEYRDDDLDRLDEDPPLMVGYVVLKPEELERMITQHASAVSTAAAVVAGAIGGVLTALLLSLLLWIGWWLLGR